MAESYEVLWSGEIETRQQKAAQRSAPQLPADRRGHLGNVGHITLPGERNVVREDPAVTQLRADWMGGAKQQT
jgi:hypothetical protein